MPIEAKGSVLLDLVSKKKVTQADVLCIPKCTSNIISIRQLDSKAVRMTISGGSLQANHANGKTLSRAQNCRGLYVLEVVQAALEVFEDYNESQQKATTYQGIKEPVDAKNILLWDARLGYLSLAMITAIAKLSNIRIHDDSPDVCTCEACLLRKKDRR